MDTVYRYLPACIPRELHEIIYMYAGTCTPSCENIKLYKEQIRRDIFPIQTETLWGALIAYAPPRYMTKRFNQGLLRDQELDLKIAFHQNSHNRFVVSFRKWGEIDDFERAYIDGNFYVEIEKIRREQTKRLFNKHGALLLGDSLPHI